MYRSLISLMAAGSGGGPGGGSYTFTDSDAEAFYTATGLESDSTVYFTGTAQEITGAAMAEAVDDLVIAMKAAGVWTKCHAIYPLIGGDATTHSFNLKNPAAYQITWTGTLTHNETGVTGSGGGHGDTGFNPSSGLASAHDNHISVYSRSTNSGATDRMEIGSSNGSNGHIYMGVGVAFVGGASFANNGSNVTLSPASGGGQGFYLCTRRANNDMEMYRNGSSTATNATASTGISPNLNMYVLAVNTASGADFRTNKNVAFASIGTGLTDTEAADYHTAVEAFQDALSRGVA